MTSNCEDVGGGPSGECNGTVTDLESGRSKLTEMPDIVTPRSPGDRLMLTMAKPAGLSVKV